jgi:uncharacterized protein YjbJ (UPF0337 family)
MEHSRGNHLLKGESTEDTMTMKAKVRNMFKVSRGKIKETTGSAIGNEKLESEGKFEQRMGNLNQAEEKVKDAFKRP